MAVPGSSKVYKGWLSVSQRIKESLPLTTKTVLVVDTYPGVNDDEMLNALEANLHPSLIICTLDLKKPEPELLKLIEGNLTHDRVFGVFSDCDLGIFFDSHKLDLARRKLEIADKGLVLVYGVGAQLVARGDVLVYADMARWEIQLRYRRGMGNWGAANGNEDFFRKYKRGFFVEWRAADRHKFRHFERVDYFLDTHKVNEPRMIAGDSIREALKHTVERPFRVVPYFDPAPWGGQWIRRTCALNGEVKNYGWGFDCVPEENSLVLGFGNERIELPCLNLVHREPVSLLGESVYKRFGREFPIRFDFLNTMGGGNLSLQVHPETDFIRKNFGMRYTQDESYYVLDAEPDACVYLGLREGINPQEMIRDLKGAQERGTAFDAEKYVTRWPARKHDHFLIPAGTVHCSGADSMVLEISATPYIFTFKLWDWQRLGLDGKPRPIHLNHGISSIQWDRTSNWVKNELINRVEPIARGDVWREEKTGLHPSEFIETRRHWFRGKTPHHTLGGVNVLNLISGQEAIVESPDDHFKPFVVHYAETFIVPAAIGSYTIRPHGVAEGCECATIKAFVRT